MDIGRICKKYRQENTPYYQVRVAMDTGYSVENVSSFETGRNDNGRILLWYFEHGLTFDYIRRVRNGEYT